MLPTLHPSPENGGNRCSEFTPLCPNGAVRLWLTCAAWLSLAVVTGMIAIRVSSHYQEPGRFDVHNQGYCDFHNGVYYPALAFTERFSPYGQNYANNFPVERPIPMFAPTVLLLHAPIAWLDLRTAEVFFYLLMVFLLVLISAWSLRVAGWSQASWLVGGLAAFLAASRTGYGTLFTGYFTFELVLGTLLAVFAGHRPVAGGIGLAIACIKPTTGIPLVILMLARGQVKTVLVGLAIVGLTSVAALLWVASDGTSLTLAEQIRDSQQQHRDDPNELPANTWTRVDLLAVVAKWFDWRPNDLQHLGVMLPLIALPALAVWRFRRFEPEGGPEGPSAGLSAAVILLSINVCIYHHYYDILVLTPVVLAAVSGSCGWRQTGFQRWIVGGLCLFPIVNYLTSNMVLDRLQLHSTLEKVFTSANGAMLAIALAICTWQLWRAGTPVEPLPAPRNSG